MLKTQTYITIDTRLTLSLLTLTQHIKHIFLIYFLQQTQLISPPPLDLKNISFSVSLRKSKEKEKSVEPHFSMHLNTLPSGLQKFNEQPT